MRYVHAKEYYSATRKKEFLPFAITWVDFEGTILNEITQRKTNTTWYHVNVEP